MGDKKLTIAVEAKIGQSVQQLSKVMKDLTSSNSPLGKLLGGTSTAGMSPAGSQAMMQGGLAKALMQDKKLMDETKKSGLDLAKVLKDNLAKAHADLGKEVEKTSKALTEMVKKHQHAAHQVETVIAEGGEFADVRTELAQRYANRAGLNVLQAAAEKSMVEGAAGVGGAGGGGRGGIGGLGALGGNLLYNAIGKAGLPGAGMLASMGGTAMGVAGVASAAVVGFMMGNKLTSYGAGGGLAAAREIGGGQAAQYGLGANFDLQYFIGRGTAGTAAERAQLVKRDWWAQFGHMGRALLRAAPLIGNNETLMGALESERDAYLAGKDVREMDYARQKGARFDAQAQQIRDLIGKGYVENRLRYGNNIYNQLSGQVRGRGELIGVDERMGFVQGLAPMVGARAAGGYAASVAAAQLSGMDPAQALRIIGGTAAAGINPLGAGAGADPTIRGILGEAVAGTMGLTSSMYAGAGASLATGMASAITQGGPGGVREAQQTAAGIGLMGQFFGGHDPYQKSYNIAAASAALGSGGTPYQRAFLAEQMRDPKVLADIMAGKLPSTFESIGITRNQAQAAARDIDRGLTNRWFDTGDNSPASQRMRQMKNAGGPMAWSQMLKTLPPAERRRAIDEVAPLFAYVQEGLLGGETGAGVEALYGAAGVTPGARGKRAIAAAAAGTAPPEDPMETTRRAAHTAEIKSIFETTKALNELGTAAGNAKKGVSTYNVHTIPSH